MFQLLNPDDPSWGRYFQSLPAQQQDIFYSPGYAELCARYMHRNAQAFCAVLDSESSFIMYPFLFRDIASLGSNGAVGAGYHDITGLYGRGGLVGNVSNSKDVARFHDALYAYCRERQIICGFDRYHPVMRNNECAAPRTQVFDVGGFVVVDLGDPITEIERKYRYSLRKHIKKAERAGVEVFSEASTKHVDQFDCVYSATLQRNGAREFYYFDSAFYGALATRLEGNYRFFYATVNDVIVSCELVLFHGLYCHSFIGGTLEPYQDSCPNHLLKRQIIRDAHAMGCRYYLLGGGQSPYDSVWNYKRCFAPNGSLPSLVGGTVFDQAAYDSLRQAFPNETSRRFQFYDQT
jgi:hypothetical protein